MARSRRCVCALRSSLKRPWMLATTKSKRSQHIVLIVQRPVGQNVGLDAFEDPEVLAEALVQPVGFRCCCAISSSRRVRPRSARTWSGRRTRNTRSRAGAWPWPSSPGSRCRRRHRCGSEGFPRRSWIGDELRQLAFQSQLDLAAALPEFRIDERAGRGACRCGPPRRRSGCGPLCNPSVANRIPFSAAKAWSLSM